LRILAVVLCAALATAAVFAGTPDEARADLPGAPDRTPTTTASSDELSAPPSADAQSPQPGTDEEAVEYARREAGSPEVQEFSGGFVIFLLTVVVLILLIVLLARAI